MISFILRAISNCDSSKSEEKFEDALSLLDFASIPEMRYVKLLLFNLWQRYKLKCYYYVGRF